MKIAHRRGLAALLLLAALFPRPCPAAGETGIEGLAAHRGDFLAGAVVLAFDGPGPGPEDVPLAVSAPTDDSGRYRLLLPAGSYYLAAVKGEGAPWPFLNRPGSYFCYYLGNPIVVEEGKMTRVGLNMVRIESGGDSSAGERAGIEGRLLFEGAPLGRAYVYVYRDGKTNFRGMGLAALPTGEDGRFRTRLAPGTYFVLARKRQAGGMYGPPGKDDYIGYYPGNPVTVSEGRISSLTLELTKRVDMLEEIWFADDAGAGWLEGTVVDEGGNPVQGLYVLFYGDPRMEGKPAFVAGPTDGSGKFRVRSAAGTWHIMARPGLGGPVEEGQWYGKYEPPGGGEGFRSGSGEKIRIVVRRPPR